MLISQRKEDVDINPLLSGYCNELFIFLGVVDHKFTLCMLADGFGEDQNFRSNVRLAFFLILMHQKFAIFVSYYPPLSIPIEIWHGKILENGCELIFRFSYLLVQNSLSILAVVRFNPCTLKDFDFWGKFEGQELNEGFIERFCCLHPTNLKIYIYEKLYYCSQSSMPIGLCMSLCMKLDKLGPQNFLVATVLTPQTSVIQWLEPKGMQTQTQTCS